MRSRALIAGLVALFLACLWIVSVASALVSIVLAVAIAIAWCIWLEKEPNPPEGRRVGGRTHAVTMLPLLLVSARSVGAQTATDPNPGNLTVTASFDAVSTYMFRGFRQHSTGVALWPVADMGFTLFSGDRVLKSGALNLGTWNSLHTGDTGTDGPTGKLWYESDFYSTLTLGFGRGIGVATTYTAYTSPNNAFTTVKEIMFKTSVDDSTWVGKAGVKPYAIVAFEFDTDVGVGQVDGGAKAGRYLEIGMAPGYSTGRASVSVPVKLGLSLANYYERNTGTAAAPAFVDDTFGYFSVAGVVTVPLGKTSSFGTWNVHGGLEFQTLGDTTRALNGGERSQVVGSAGVGFTY